MSDFRRASERRRLSRGQHSVEFRVPESGLGQRLNEMHDRAEAGAGPGGYSVSKRLSRSRVGRSEEYLRFNFADSLMADAFAALFNGTRLIGDQSEQTSPSNSVGRSANISGESMRAEPETCRE